MKKRCFTGAVVGFCILLIMGFGSFATAQEFKWPPIFRIATTGSLSGNFAQTNSWGPKFAEAMGVQVRVIPEDNEIRRYVRFAEGKEFELNCIAHAVMVYIIQGDLGFTEKKAYPLHTVWPTTDTPWGFVVRGDSKYKTIYDLKQKGVRVAVATGNAPMVKVVKEALPAFLGWTPEEAEKNWIFVPTSSYAENCRSVTDGKADISWASPISAVAYEMEAHPSKIRWLDVPFKDKDGWKRYLDVRPTTIPAKLTLGVPSAIGVEAVTSGFLYWARADADQEMIYRITKWFHQNHEDYKATHALNARMGVKYFREYLDYAFFPVAEGTVRYLKEIGQWSAADDKWNNEAIALMDRWVKARNAALDEAKAKGVKIHWENKEYLDILGKHTKDIPVFRLRGN
jgi:hypothetical protein